MYVGWFKVEILDLPSAWSVRGSRPARVLAEKGFFSQDRYHSPENSEAEDVL
jgi:hypothetical protein